MDSFHPPKMWGFKPFFTIQPVLNTREKQLQLWRDLIIQYHIHANQFSMIPSTFAFFENKTIDRKLSVDAINTIVDFMIASGNAEWEDGQKTRLLIIWRRPEALAGDIYNWVLKNQYVDNVFTIFELHSGEEHQDSGFYGTDPYIFRKSLEILESARKCAIFQGATSNEDGHALPMCMDWLKGSVSKTFGPNNRSSHKSEREREDEVQIACHNNFYWGAARSTSSCSSFRHEPESESINETKAH
eukprot:gene4390-8739_t